MPTPTFKRVSLIEFDALLARFPFSRRITAVHMHHTWRPDRKTFKGHQTIVSMWRYHTKELGWSDIAQHITIDPEGFIWLGRNWNARPASASGHNGNEHFGPFMFEMIGNFDKGHDPFDGPQRETALQVIAMVQVRFGLANNTLMFHNALSSKSCPGNSLDYDEILKEVEKRKEQIRTRTLRAAERAPGPFPDEPDARTSAAIEALHRAPRNVIEPADAELSHREQGSELEQALDRQLVRGQARPVSLDPATLAALRPHLINLTMGRFSDDGQVGTSPADVNAIFEKHLPEAIQEAKEVGQKLRLLFYAHGGLVSESSGLQLAAKHIEWWKKNGIYPIYFIWETGLFETLGQLLKQSQRTATRGMARDLWDHTLDPIIEIAAHTLHGPRIWGGMKSSAEHAVDTPTDSNPTGGGAWHTAVELKKFCGRNAADIELHAIGHSAGSIFHSYFLTLARDLDVPTFTTCHFLAPAVRADTFKQLIGSRLGENKAIKKLTVFTMKKDYEKADNCAGIYHKSLLYLIFNALEDARATPILGLEESLRSDAELKALFGLGNTASDVGEVVWSVTEDDTGRSASRSASHGGFDDDAPTMDSLARRILGKEDADPIAGYGSARDIAPIPRSWMEETDWPEAPDTTLQPSAIPMPATSSPDLSPAAAKSWAPASGSASLSKPNQPGSGRRHALCIGINRYPGPGQELAGCVADARMWADGLTRLGFSATVLTDGQATREAISRQLLALVDNSRAGDVIVFQYAGHGTTVPDLDGDEPDQQDEAICPIDFNDGALYIDDDIAEVFGRLPDGVNLTCFMDCCHSGTNTRFAVGAPPETPRAGRDERKRYIKATPELVAAHIQFRQKFGSSKRTLGTGGRSLMRDIKFSACLDSEVAWESDGHGEFTLRAVRILAAGIDGLSNEQFLRRLVSDFGMGTRQHPMLDCGPGSGLRPLLQPLIGNGHDMVSVGTALEPRLDETLVAHLQHLLSQLVAR